MRIAICIDNQNGIAFNHRRQTSDFRLCTTILAVAMQKSVRLLMSPSSMNMFQERMKGKGFEPILEDTKIIEAREDYLKIASDKDICFIENSKDLEFCLQHEPPVSELIIYKWNTVYPQDEKLPFDLSLGKNWLLKTSRDFEGSSHPKITEERYSRNV